MATSRRAVLNSIPVIESGGRYFIALIDNSRSMHETKIGEQSLFSLQIEQINTLLTALKTGKKRDDTHVLLVTFDGALDPGWQPLMDVHYLNESAIPESNCSPILDILGGILDTLELVAITGIDAGKDVKCSMLVVTDGLDGFNVGSRAFPVSVSTVAQIRKRMERHYKSGYVANALAIGPDGGKAVTDFFLSVGFNSKSIVSSELDPQKLRRAYEDVSESSFRDLHR